MIPLTAVIYSNGSQECDRAASLLKSLGGEYLEYRLNQHFTQRAFEQEFGPEAQYPQIAIGARHIGHLKEMLHYAQEQELLK
jgi:glutaredoxin